MFYYVINEKAKKVRAFVLGKHFQPNLILAGNMPVEDSKKCYVLVVLFPTIKLFLKNTSLTMRQSKQDCLSLANLSA